MPVLSRTPTTVPTEPGTAGGFWTAGTWTRRGPSAIPKSCPEAAGGGWSPYRACLPSRSSGLPRTLAVGGRAGLIGAEMTNLHLWLPRDRKNTDFRRKDETMHEMMDFEVWKQRREEMAREADQNRLAKELRESRKKRGSGSASSVSWEVKRIVGRLRKRFRP